MAEAKARKAAELDTTSPHNFGAVGNTLSGVGKVKESLGFYKKALEITPHAEAWIKYNYMNALVSIGEYEEGKRIAMEISITDQFVNDARARALAVLAFIAHKEGKTKSAITFMENLNRMALNTEQSGSKLETIMWGFWNVKSNENFIEDFKETMMELGI